MPELLQYWPVIAFLATVVAIPGAGWIIRMGLASKDDLRAEADARGRADAEIDERLSKVETDMGHMPSKEAFHAMDVTLAELRGEIQVLAERLKPVASIADRLQEFLYEEAKKR